VKIARPAALHPRTARHRGPFFTPRRRDRLLKSRPSLDSSSSVVRSGGGRRPPVLQPDALQNDGDGFSYSARDHLDGHREDDGCIFIRQRMQERHLRWDSILCAYILRPKGGALTSTRWRGYRTWRWRSRGTTIRQNKVLNKSARDLHCSWMFFLLCICFSYVRVTTFIWVVAKKILVLRFAVFSIDCRVSLPWARVVEYLCL
jgi:hypothetical protein